MSVAWRTQTAQLAEIPDSRSGLAARRYAFALLAVALALVVRGLLHDILGHEAPFLVFVPAVLLAARQGGLGPGLLATGLSLAAATYFFVPPTWSFAVRAPEYLLQMVIFGGIGGTISLLNTRLLSATRRAGERLRALEASEERFRLLVEGVQDYALFMLDPEGRVLLWNPGAERIKGYTAEEILGQHLSVFYPPERRAEAESHLREAAEKGQLQAEEVRVRKDGSRFWAHVTLTALRDPQGELRGFAKVTRDITDRKQADEEIQRLTEILEQRVIQRTAQLQDANQALESFAYSVSHDLRAPLRAMQGFAEALVEDYGDRLDGTGLEYARRVVGAAERMDRLITDLLTYSRISRVEAVPQTVALDAVVAEASQEVQEDLRARGGEIEVQGALPPVLAHRPTLMQAVTNLLANAVKFVAPGVAPRVRVRAETRGRRVRLWIEDNGIGIAPEHQDRVFRVFERLHGMEIYPGTGVGLGIVRKGVERMGGSTGVESAPGAGSRFWIELPQAGEGT